MLFVHLSDLHLRRGWYEEQQYVLSALFKDLELRNMDDQAYLVFSGDLVQAGSDVQLYDEFTHHVMDRLISSGIPRENFIIVPGNHDVDAKYVKDHLTLLLGTNRELQSENSVNNFVESKDSHILSDKFGNYTTFEACSARFGCADNFSGHGFKLSDTVGIYCLNTALFCCGGNLDNSGTAIIEREQLFIETRQLHKWLQDNNVRTRILVMHHPITWLSVWAQAELKNLINAHFNIVFHGHVHNQDVDHFYLNDGNCTILSAPPLFTRKQDKLGYSVTTITSGGIEIEYRQWSHKHSKFVAGTLFSGTDDGILRFPHNDPVISNAEVVGNIVTRAHREISNILRERFSRALNFFTYGTRVSFWVVPDIGTAPEGGEQSAQALIRSASAVAALTQNLQITALPQFGLTSLGHYLAFRKHEIGQSTLPLVISSTDAPNHAKAIRQYVLAAVTQTFGLDAEPDCIIVDDFDPRTQQSSRQATSIQQAFPGTQIILLSKYDHPEILQSANVVLGDDFEQLHLWSLSRTQIRSLTRQYIEAGSALHEDHTVDRLIDHFTVLNLPRTAHYCLTLLTIFDSQIDTSPVNRTELIESFLQVLFSRMQKIPKYSTVPDLKDSLFALGQF